MKICFVTTGDVKNIATAKRALGMANPLIKLGWEVHILMEDTVENRHRVSRECQQDVAVHFFKRSSAFKEVHEKRKLVEIIKPDFLYICAFVFRNIVITDSSCKKLVEHPELQSKIPDIKGFKKIFTHLIEDFSIFYADGLLPASRYLEKVYAAKANKFFQKNLPIHYFPYAFSQEFHQPVTLGPDHPLSRKFIHKRVFVYLGTITRNYGAFTMVQAFEKLTNLRDKVHFVMLGQGRHFGEVKELVANNGLSDYVELTGYVEEEDINNYFSIADAFILPMNETAQDWARCPSKLYMYLPYNKPVITCRIGEPPAVLNDAGIYYQSGSSEDMAQKIAQLVEQNQWDSSTNPHLHTWEQRSKEFDSWIKTAFKK